MFSIFRDPELRAQFDRDGFLTLPFLDETALTALRGLFESVKPKVSLQGFATTTTSPDLALKQEIFASVQPWYAEKVESLFENYKLLGTSFLQKDPGQAGSLRLHQDWTATDETHFRTLTIWVPLEDCNIENGAIQMLPGSHRWLNVLRGPNLPPAILDVAPELEKGLVTLPLKAGEAVMFDHSILHRSLLNTSGKPRIALTFGLTHCEAPLRFWYHHAGDAPDRLEQLAMPDDFFLRYHQIGMRPEIGNSLGFYRQDLTALTAEEAISMQTTPIHRPIYRDLGDKTCLLQKPVFPITRRTDWNQALAEQGYVCFPLLDAAAVSQLRQAFAESQSAPIDRFYASVHSPDIAFRMRMDAAIQAVLRPLLAEILAEGEPLGSSFIAKPKGSGGILPPHADWNIVDERLWRSYNLWIPLVDTTVENGAVHVIPGSHAWLDYYRGPGIANPFEPLHSDIWNAMLPLEMPAGTALLYDHRLLHASPTNRTDTLRLACVTGIKPKAAAMRYYHGQAGIVSEYAADPDFFLQQNPENGPADLPLLGEVTNAQPLVTAVDLRRFLGVAEEAAVVEAAPPVTRGFWQTYTPRNIWREILWRIRR